MWLGKRKTLIVNQVLAVVNLGIAGFYGVTILWHMFHPGENIEYTRMLMFVCLGTIPMVFMLALFGGYDRWMLWSDQLREWARHGFWTLIAVLGLLLVLCLLPVGLLLGVWFGMGLKFGLLFLLYFLPLGVRMVTTSSKASTEAAIMQTILYFTSFFLGIGITAVVSRLPGGVTVYEQHVQKIWPNYSDAAKVFFSVSMFALVNQMLEARHALIFLLRK